MFNVLRVAYTLYAHNIRFYLNSLFHQEGSSGGSLKMLELFIFSILLLLENIEKEKTSARKRRECDKEDILRKRSEAIKRTRNIQKQEPTMRKVWQRQIWERAPETDFRAFKNLDKIRRKGSEYVRQEQASRREARELDNKRLWEAGEKPVERDETTVAREA